MLLKRFIYIIVVFSLLFQACIKEESGFNPSISKIAFGSCANAFTRPDEMNIFSTIHSMNPDLYIAMGDNMYADVDALIDAPFYDFFIKFNYALLDNNFHFKKMRKDVPVIGTWDDHDYGINNAGKSFPHKEKSKEAFIDFFRIDENNGMHNRDGIYESYYYGLKDQKLQIILLDTRWNLDVISPEPITPTNNVTKNILGEAQWEWLEKELLKPATIRIIGSSTQFGIEPNGYESWANFPHEMTRMFELIKSTHAEGVFFISGDVHYSEVSKREIDGLYPIYDFTASGLTHHEEAAKPNKYRVGEAYANNNFGILNINWNSTPISITYDIHDKQGELVRTFTTDVEELNF